MRDRGIEALAIAALLARLGTADPVEPVASLDALVATVDFARVGRSAARFSEEELAHLSARTLHAMSYVSVRARLPDVSEALWLAVRGNLQTLADVTRWLQVVAGPVAPVIEDAPFLSEPPTGCRPSRGMTPPGKAGPVGSAARGGRCSIRCGWR